jgi:hypothetical protein
MLAFEPPRLMEFEWGTDTFDEIGKAARDGADASTIGPPQ